MSNLVQISHAAKILGVSITTLRRWEKEGKITPQYTKSGHRRYDLQALIPQLTHSHSHQRRTIAYARVSTQSQKADLERQKQLLELYCAAQGWKYELISDLGSGINYHKKGLTKLLHAITDNNIGRLVLTHKDRLLRFGAELVFALCEAKQVEVVIINQSEVSSFEEELVQDVLEVITVFSARLYGSRSRKNQQLITAMQDAVNKVKNE